MNFVILHDFNEIWLGEVGEEGVESKYGVSGLRTT